MKKPFSEILVLEMGKILSPIKELEDFNSLIILLEELGYELDSTDGEVALLSGIQDLLSIIQDLIDLLKNYDSISEDNIELVEDIILIITKAYKEIQDNLDPVKAFLNSNSINSTINDFDDFPKRLIEYLIITYFSKFRQSFYAINRILGLFGKEEDSNSGISYVVINWERYKYLFSGPITLFNEEYHWDTNFKDQSEKFLSRLEQIFLGLNIPTGLYNQSDSVRSFLNNEADTKELRIPFYQGGNWPDNWNELSINISSIPSGNGNLSGLFLYPYFFGQILNEFDLNENFSVEIEQKAELDAGFGMQIRPPFDIHFKTDIFSSPTNSGDLSSQLNLKLKSEDEYILVGRKDSSRLSVRETAFSIFAVNKNDKQDFGVDYTIKEFKIVIGGGEGDGFLQTVLPEEGITASFSMTLGYSIVKGFYFVGSGSFEIVVASHIQLGPLDINNLTLGFAPGTDGLGLTTAAGLKLELGPFVAVVEGLGLKSDLTFPDEGGNLGPADLAFGFKPPTGIGLSLDASIVKGGGYLFFEPEEERYGGALELVIAEKISVVAIALITTRFPDGSKGFSLLLLISVEFSPGIALGMGFFLSGLGGMIGLNRTVNTDALRAGVKQGSVDHILFPTDVVANIQRIITDLREFFPPQRDQFIIGLMAKLTWGVPTLLSVEFGIAIEFKSPVRLAILGVIKLVLPTEDEAIIRIQVNFIGVIDFDEGYLMFDASLFGSKILTFTLEGDMALRIFWGKQKEFLLSVGGFHPAYSPPAFLKVANMTRLTLNILSGNPSLTLTTYFAITSNTVQFGAQIDFYFKVSKFKVIGYFGFDVLFQFSPFRFIAGIRAGVEVMLGSTVLFAIQLAFELQGPTPWIANGTASFKILFIKISVKFSKTWGERREDILPGIPVLPKLLEALEQPRNWVGDLPSNKFLLTSMKKIDLEEGQILMHAAGTLTIRQTIMPLGMEISKFGNYTPVDIKSAFISSINIDGKDSSFKDVKDGFAPAEFKEMEDQDKLTAPSYKDEVSGVKITATESLHLNYGINRIVNYEVRVSDYDRKSEQPYALYNPLRKDILIDKQSLFRKMTKGGAVGKSELSQELKKQNFRNEKAVNLQPENYVITNVADLSLFDSIDFNGGTKAEADDQLKKAIRNNPSLKDKIQVVNEFELVP